MPSSDKSQAWIGFTLWLAKDLEWSTCCFGDQVQSEAMVPPAPIYGAGGPRGREGGVKLATGQLPLETSGERSFQLLLSQGSDQNLHNLPSLRLK